VSIRGHFLLALGAWGIIRSESCEDTKLPPHSFSSSDLSEILARAQEISSGKSGSVLQTQEVAEILDAAEEAGLDREATLMALQERLAQVNQDYSPGELVFALSSDGHSYPAIVVEKTDNRLEIRFMNGTRVRLGVHEVQPFSLTPGIKLHFQNPTMGIWTEGEVVRYNEDGRSLTFKYWGQDNTVSLDQVRINRAKPTFSFTSSVKAKVITLVLSASALSGAIGFLIGFLAGR